MRAILIVRLTVEIIWPGEDSAEGVWVHPFGGVDVLNPENNHVLSVTLPDGLVAEDVECVARFDSFGNTKVPNDCVDASDA